MINIVCLYIKKIIWRPINPKWTLHMWIDTLIRPEPNYKMAASRDWSCDMTFWWTRKKGIHHEIRTSTKMSGWGFVNVVYKWDFTKSMSGVWIAWGMLPLHTNTGCTCTDRSFLYWEKDIWPYQTKMIIVCLDY